MSLEDRIPPEVAVNGKIPEYRLRHDLPLREIRTLEAEKGHGQASSVLGFTTFEAKKSTRSELRFFKNPPDPAGCFWPSRLLVDFDVTHIDVFIPVEYQPGSCEYNEVLSHEIEHVKILSDTHAEYLIRIRELVTDFVASYVAAGPQVAASGEEGNRVVLKEIGDLLSTVTDDFSKLLDERQQTIDTPENYARVSARCTNWE